MEWYETTEGYQRLLWECHFLSQDYPSMQVQRGVDGIMRATGILGPSNLANRRMYIVAEFPSNYPNGRPRVYAPYETFPPNTPHIYPSCDIELCTFHGADFGPDDTMSTVLGWTIQWIALYDKFRETDERW